MAVRMPAIQSGMPNSRLKPSAAPRNSARSVAMATSSISTHMIHTTGAGNARGTARPGSAPVAMPSLADSVWISMAIRLLATTTHSSM